MTTAELRQAARAFAQAVDMAAQGSGDTHERLVLAWQRYLVTVCADGSLVVAGLLISRLKQRSLPLTAATLTPPAGETGEAVRRWVQGQMSPVCVCHRSRYTDRPLPTAQAAPAFRSGATSRHASEPSGKWSRPQGLPRVAGRRRRGAPTRLRRAAADA
ncbi:MAG: hypothetical protein ACR2JY_00010 [Chloroflexota bacterium]